MKDECMQPVSVELTVNGKEVSLRIDPRATLAETLRDNLGLTGTKIGCNRGECGACTVLVDGSRWLACLALTTLLDGRKVETIEALDAAGVLHPLQRAFMEHDAFQCGFCTPGQIMSGIGCIAEGHATSDAQVREFMSGNLCRCGAYNGIVKAIRAAAGGSS
jgi:xanthine dehydrogenase YagT iron-sulfur-binding subunit